MKKYLGKISISLSLVALLASCENFVDGVSEFDPNQASNASLGQVTNAAEVAYIGFMEGDLNRIVGIFADQFAGVDRQYASLDEYTTTSGDYDSQWDNVYAGVIKSLRIVQSKADIAGNKKSKALAQILEAHTIGMMASLFGDVPYSQIVNLAQFPNPAFDDQADVYDDAIALLDAAIVNIQTASSSSKYEGDIFGGSNADWIARAYTIKAKLLLHKGDYAGAITAAEQGISSPSQDLVASHGLTYNTDLNLFASFLDWDRPGYMVAGTFAVDVLSNRGNTKTDEDARLNYYFLDDFAIYNDGWECNFLDEDYYGEPDGYFAADASWAIVTYKENQLILAEAELRENGFAGALDALNDLRDALDGGAYINADYIDVLGYTASYDAYDAADFADGGIENPDGLTPEDALYKEIIEEKYVSLLGHLEVFNDIRRNGYGSFANLQNWEVLGIPVKGANTEIPQRLLIAQSEINSNTSVPADLPGLFDRPALPQ